MNGLTYKRPNSLAQLVKSNLEGWRASDKVRRTPGRRSTQPDGNPDKSVPSGPELIYPVTSVSCVVACFETTENTEGAPRHKEQACG
jgi:hypothetical protein